MKVVGILGLHARAHFLHIAGFQISLCLYTPKRHYKVKRFTHFVR